MTSRPDHPPLEEWIAWLQGLAGGEEARALEEHLNGCSSCAAEVAILRDLHRIRTGRGWHGPSDTALSRAREMPRSRPAPAFERSASEIVHWRPTDIRGEGSAVAGEAQIVARSCRSGELSVMAIPPRGDALWQIEGRVWLHEPSTKPILVILSQDDHVLCQLEAYDGAPFGIHELLGPSWRLEFHLPDGEIIVLEDEFA